MKNISKSFFFKVNYSFKITRFNGVYPILIQNMQNFLMLITN